MSDDILEEHRIEDPVMDDEKPEQDAPCGIIRFHIHKDKKSLEGGFKGWLEIKKFFTAAGTLHRDEKNNCLIAQREPGLMEVFSDAKCAAQFPEIDWVRIDPPLEHPPNLDN